MAEEFQSEGMIPPQNRTESESEVQLLAKSKVVKVTEQLPVTARSVNPVFAAQKAMDAGVFLDVSGGPVRPTCWTSESTLATCPQCKATGKTKVGAGLSRASLFFTGALCMTCGLCVFAMLCPCCKDTRHYCGKCGGMIGRRSAM